MPSVSSADGLFLERLISQKRIWSMARTPARHMFRALGCAAAIALPALLASAAVAPAQAQFNLSIGIGFDNFHSRLAPYGRWSNHPRWGEVWHPTRVGRDFRPYYNGHWVNTREYGWMWDSDESWGDVTYHYGRWVRDPREGWLWVPGYVWGPSWVVWRSGGGNICWFPMPPGDNYYGEGAYRDNFDNEYGYRDWSGPGFDNNQFLSLWVFVGEDHFGDRNFRNHAVPQRDYGRFIGQTRDATNYTTVNNYVVNRSVDANRLQQDTRRRFEPVPARSVIRDTALVTPAPAGRQIEQRESRQHPIPASQNIPERNAPAANANQPGLQGGPQGRGNDRNPASDRDQTTPRNATVGPVAQPTPSSPANPAQERGGRDRTPAEASQSNAPRVAPVGPVAQPTPSSSVNPAPERGGRDRTPAEAGQSNAPRVAPVGPVAQPTPSSSANPAQERGGRDRSPADAGPLTPQAPRIAPTAPVATPPPPTNPAQDRGGRDRNPAAAIQPTPQAPRIAPTAPAATPPPPANSAQDRGGRGNQQPDRGAAAQAPARPQANAPAPDGQSNARGNRPNDTSDDRKKTNDKKNDGGPN
jgi:hypothetical protein